MPLAYQPKTVRDLLLDMGVRHFNATMMVETVFMTPATTEASSAPVMLLVGHIQDALNQMGASPPLVRTGMIDPATAFYLVQIAGPDFLYKSWFDTLNLVVQARAAKRRLTAQGKDQLPLPPKSQLGFLDLPDVPGGALTYAVGAYLIYRALKKKRS